MSLIDKKQKERITEILREKGYEVLGFGEMENEVVIGIVPIYHKEISAKLSEVIKDEMGVDTTINL